MSARDVIAWTMKSLGAFDPTREADEVLVTLHAAGYRILAPGELDAETVEKCAQVAERAGKPVGASDGGTYVVGSATDAATAIRALASGKSTPPA